MKKRHNQKVLQPAASGTPTAIHLRKLVNQDLKPHINSHEGGAKSIGPSETVKGGIVSNSFARDCGNFDTFGRPSAMSQE